jgi:hypothetical protein
MGVRSAAASAAIANADVATLRGERVKALRLLLSALHGHLVR